MAHVLFNEKFVAVERLKHLKRAENSNFKSS